MYKVKFDLIASKGDKSQGLGLLDKRSQKCN